jgi:hypothetical protein
MAAGSLEVPGDSGAAPRCPGCGSSHPGWAGTVAQGRTERVSVLECPVCGLRAICVTGRR